MTLSSFEWEGQEMVKTGPDSLIAAAAELLDNGGPGAVTLRGVGLGAGVSRGAPYHHFATKTELLAAIATRELDLLADDFLAVQTKGAAAAREMMVIYLRWALQYPERFRLTFGRWENDDARLGAAAARIRKAFVAAVAEAQQRRELPTGDPVRLAALLLSAMHGAADLAVAGHLSPTRQGRIDVGDLVTDLFGHLQAAAVGSAS
jgi:AcrR family transcriptional regulator